MYYLVIALFILMLIGFISTQNQKIQQEEVNEAEAQAQAKQKASAVNHQNNDLPPKYGYVPPPAYNPYDTQNSN